MPDRRGACRQISHSTGYPPSKGATLSQIPRLKRGWLRLWFTFTEERHCLLDGEGPELSPPIRRPSLTNRRVALRGPAPRAKPDGAPPRPWGFLARPEPGEEATPIPWRVKCVLHGNHVPSAFRRHYQVPSRDWGRRARSRPWAHQHRRHQDRRWSRGLGGRAGRRSVEGRGLNSAMERGEGGARLIHPWIAS